MKSKPKKKSPSALYRVIDGKPRKGESRKAKITEAVIECLARRGLEETTFDAIGKMVKMERAHVNYYFANRKELIKAAVRYAVGRGQEIIIGHVKKAQTWRDRVTVVIEGPFEWLETYPDHATVMVLFYYLCTYDEELRQLQSLIRVGGEERLSSCLQSLVEGGKLTSAKATSLARGIQTTMTGALILNFSCTYPLTLRQLRDKVVRESLAQVESCLE